MELQNLIGNTISHIECCTYGTKVKIEFIDGSCLVLSAGEDGIHNDRWNTVDPTAYSADELVTIQKEQEERLAKQAEEKRAAKKEKAKQRRKERAAEKRAAKLGKK